MCSNLRTHRYDPEEDWGLSVVRLVSLDDQCETILGWRWKWICYWLKCWIKWSVREVSVSFVSGDEGGRMFWMSWAAGRMRTMKVCKELNWRPQPLVTAMFFLFTSSSSHVGATEPPDGPTTPPVGSPQLSTGSRSFWSLWFDVKQQWRVRTDGGLGGGVTLGRCRSHEEVCSRYTELRGGWDPAGSRLIPAGYLRVTADGQTG